MVAVEEILVLVVVAVAVLLQTITVVTQLLLAVMAVMVAVAVVLVMLETHLLLVQPVDVEMVEVGAATQVHPLVAEAVLVQETALLELQEREELALVMAEMQQT
jgi:hypothetical protein